MMTNENLGASLIALPKINRVKSEVVRSLICETQDNLEATKPSFRKRYELSSRLVQDAYDKFKEKINEQASQEEDENVKRFIEKEISYESSNFFLGICQSEVDRWLSKCKMTIEPETHKYISLIFSKLEQEGKIKS